MLLVSHHLVCVRVRVAVSVLEGRKCCAVLGGKEIIAGKLLWVFCYGFIMELQFKLGFEG